jgi:transposase
MSSPSDNTNRRLTQVVIGFAHALLADDTLVKQYRGLLELAPWSTVPSVFLKLRNRNTTMDMTMSSAKPTRVEVVTSVQRRRRWTPEQKLEIVKQTNEPGSSVSMVARQFGITAAQLFQWRKAYLQGSLMAVGANETVVPASELQEAMRRIKQLEGALGRKTLENEILKEAVDFAKAKKWIARSPVLPGDEQ